MPLPEEKLKQMIAEQLGRDPSEIGPGMPFDDLGMDSLDRVELVMAMEEAFDVQIPDEAAEQMRTVQDVVDYINKNAKSVKQ